MSNTREPLSPAAARELGEQRESWCAVERTKDQDWCRKERAHSDGILQSTCFDLHRPEYEPRCTFEVNAPTHRERKHFKQQCACLVEGAQNCLHRIPRKYGYPLYNIINRQGYKPNQHLDESKDPEDFIVILKKNKILKI